MLWLLSAADGGTIRNNDVTMTKNELSSFCDLIVSSDLDIILTQYSSVFAYFYEITIIPLN